MTSQNHVIARSCNLMSRNPSWHVTILPSLVTICIIRLLTRNFGKMTLLRHLEKSVRTKGLCTHHKERKTGGSGFFVEGVFLKRSLCMLLLRPFPCAKTTYNLLWISKNVTNIRKTLNVRENKIKIESCPDWEICFS